MRPVAVIGAGLAGLSAAVELSLRGIPVAVFEQKPFPGGRAYSFVDRESGDTIDNGQHAMIGGYTATLRFLDQIGTRHLLWIQDRPSLQFHHPVKGFRQLSLPSLPSPLHLAAGVVQSDLFSLRDKIHLLSLGNAFRHLDRRRTDLDAVSTRDWLHALKQTPETVQSFWEPLTIAIMNQKSEQASALLFSRCVHRAFFESKSNATLILPSVGLSELFADPACALIGRMGGQVRLGCRVLEIIVERNTATAIRLADGTKEEVSAVIVAVPPWSVNSLIALPPGTLDAFKPSPIVSIHFWFDKSFMPSPFIGVIGKTVQWIFDRRKIAERSMGGGHISCVISAATEIVDLDNQEILALAENDVSSVFGRDFTKPKRGVVIREKRATFSPAPFTERYRPSAETLITNVYLAGDWTNTGLPGTIEGAVVSGTTAAALVRA